MRSAGALDTRRSKRCRLSVVASHWVVAVLVVPGHAAAQRDALNGSWMQLSAERPTVGLTPTGQAAVADYVPLRDDPDLRCEPASLTNVLGIPDPPWEILLHDDHVEINFEYMDVRRRVPLDGEFRPEDADFTVPNFPHMGRSAGRFEGDTLVIETTDLDAGFVDTLGQMYPQSEHMRTVERYRAEGDSLIVEIEHTDPTLYLAPFTMRFEYFRVDFELLEFGCTVDAANYDDRL